MRVLLLPHRYAPHSSGGVERHTEVLADALRAAGHAAAVLTLAPAVGPDVPPFSLVEGGDDPPVFRVRHRLSDARSFAETWGDDRLRSPVRAALDAFAPDVVHLLHPDGWGVVPLREAGARGLVTSVGLHDYKWLCGRGQMVRPPDVRCGAVLEDACTRCIADQLARGPAHGLVARWAPPAVATWVERRRARSDGDDPGPAAANRWRRRQRAMIRALNDADVRFSPSRFVAEVHARQGVTEPIRVVSNGLPAADRPDVASRGPGPLRIGFFGNPHPTKGLDLLLRAFASVPRGAATLELFGPSPNDVGALPDAVTAHGRYDASAAPSLAATVDVVAIPSRWDENQPLVALEARQAGRPLLVAALGGLPELVREILADLG